MSEDPEVGEKRKLEGTRKEKKVWRAVRVQKNYVKHYLRRGITYNVMGDEDMLSEQCYKPDTTVKGCGDLHWLLRTAHYWGLSDEIPEILNFVRKEHTEAELDAIHATIKTQGEVALCEWARRGDIHTLQRFRDQARSFEKQKTHKCPEEYITFLKAAMIRANLGVLFHVLQSHQATLLRVFHERGRDFKHTGVVAAAAEKGNMACLKYLLANGGTLIDNAEAFQNAILSGDLHCLKYMHRQVPTVYRFNWPSPLIDKHNVEAFYYAYRHLLGRTSVPTAMLYNKEQSVARGIDEGLPLCDQFYVYTARRHDIETFQYLHSRGCRWHHAVCEVIAEVGNLDLLQFAHENGCPWDGEKVIDTAARFGHLGCLRYADTHGCIATVNTCREAAQYGHLACLKYLHKDKELDEFKINDGEQQVIPQECPWDERVTAAAAGVKCRKFRELIEGEHDHDNREMQKRRIAMEAKKERADARRDGLACLKYVHDKSCPWDETACAAAASENNLQILEYLHAVKCPWDESTSIAAARHNHLACLKYAHEHGCPWSERVRHAVNLNTNNEYMKRRGKECMKYLDEQNCP